MTDQYLHGVRVIEINEGTRPIRSIATAIIGIVGTAPGATAQTTATLAVGDVDSDNALTFTAASAGSGGNNISLHLKDPRATDQALGVTVATAGTRSTVTISLETDATGAIATSAAEIITALAGYPDAAALLSAVNASTSDGSGPAVASIKPLPLAGGTDDAYPLNYPRLLTSTGNVAGLGTTGTLPTVVSRIRSQTNAPIVIVRVAEGADADATQTNIMGDAALKTGLYALTRAQAETGVKPRILGIPVYDNQAVTAALLNVAEATRAMVYAAVHDASTVSAAINYRAAFGSRRLVLLWPSWTAWNSSISAADTVEPVAWGLGLRAQIDYDQGWHKVLSNVELSGPTGISQGVSFGLQDVSSEANLLNENEITTLIKEAGFRYWGCRTTSLDPLFAFECATRTADVLADSIAEAHMWALDKPMHPSLVVDILEGVNAKLRELVRNGYILGGKAWFDPAANTPDVLKDGRLFIDYDYTPVPPLENPNFRQRITDTYLAEFAVAVTLAAAA